jgi:manganese oxidase
VISPAERRRLQAPELAGWEDYRASAGSIEDGVFRAALEIRTARWHPWGAGAPELQGHVFAVAGEPVRVPGPMLRVRAGTPVHLTLRNSVSDTIIVYGLRDRDMELPPDASQPQQTALLFSGGSVVVAPGAVAEVQFTATVPGDFIWFGKTLEPGSSEELAELFNADAVDHALRGLLVVDAPDEVIDPQERLFLITHWADRKVPASWLPTARFFINGRSWPHTERLEYALGDTVRWRVVNASNAFHPMHLHGFFFQVEAATRQTGTSLLPPLEGPIEAVTFPLVSTAAIRMSWPAKEPGNWIYHCHLMRHMSWMQAPTFATGEAAHHAEHTPGEAEGVDLMGGLVLGVTVVPPPKWTPPADVPRRKLDLHITKRDHYFGNEPAYSFILQDGPEPPAPDAVQFPGSLLTLRRGEPTEIVVHNRADVALAVHWHGLELESRADGVAGWSGTPGSSVPAIPPGDSFAVRMAPPRVGTFMYHVHSEPGHQLAQGLYGPFIVEDPETPRDPELDRIFLMASLGVGEDPPAALNGSLDPPAEEFRAGETYRLRFMQVSPDDGKALRLLGEGGEPVTWQWATLDAAPVPIPFDIPQPAVMADFDVGMTMDFVWTPAEPGDYVLEITTTFDVGRLRGFPRETRPPPSVMKVPFRVR